MVLGPKTIHKTINVYGFLGGMCEMMEGNPGTFDLEPPKAIWRRITEDRKMDWHRWIGTVMSRRTRYNVKNYRTSAKQNKQRPLEGTILCDP